MLGVGSTVAGRYRLERVAGVGGFGIVYRSADLETGALVAVKILDRIEDEALTRFEREVELLATLEHPAFVRYVGHGTTTTGQPFLAMEWLEGEDLATRLKRGRLAEDEAVQLATRIASALGCAHARGIVHRDVKPGNVYLVDGRVEDARLLDLGIARIAGKRTLTRTGNVVGTFGYMAPEHARGAKELGPRADVFSLGCLLFEALTGERAYAGDNPMAIVARVLFDDAPLVSSLREDVAPALVSLVARTLSRDAAARPVDGLALAEELEALGARATLAEVGAPMLLDVRVGGDDLVRWFVIVAASAASAGNLARTVSLEPEGDDVATRTERIREAAAREGARAERLWDGSIVAAIEARGGATEAAAGAARLAMLVRSIEPGSAVALATGHGAFSEVGWLGDALDRAVSLAATRRARPYGPVALDAATAHLVEGRWAVRWTSAEVAEMLGELESPQPVRALFGMPSPCVGRERELAALEGAIDAWRDERTARAVVVIGEPGVGKSRIVDELLQRAQLRHGRLRILRARRSSHVGAPPHAVVRELLRDAAGITSGDTPETAYARLTALGAPDVIAFLAELADVASPGEPTAELRMARVDAALMAERTRLATIAWLRAETSVAPVVLHLEDVQWADAASLALIDAALRVESGAPIFVVATARDDVHTRHPGLWKERACVEARVVALGAVESGELVRWALGATAEAGVVADIVGRSGGNAFFIEELVRAARSGNMSVAGRSGAHAVATPEAVIAQVQARLALLRPSERRVLRAASVLGSRLHVAEVAAVVAEPEFLRELDATLATLAADELVALGPDGVIELRHSLVREGAYASLPDAERRLAHRRAAVHLAANAGETGRIADHLERAGAPDEAAPWWLRAAERALEASDHRGAAERARRGLDAGATGDLRGRLHAVLADAEQFEGDMERRLANARTAVELLAPGSDYRARALTQLAICAVATERYDVVASAVAALRDLTPRDVSWARGAARIAYACFTVARAGEGAALLAAVERADATLRDDPLVAGALAVARASRARHDGDPWGGYLRTAEAVARLTEVGDAGRALYQRMVLAFSCMLLGLFDEAARLCAAIEASTTRGERPTMDAFLWHVQGLVLALAGDVDAGERVERRSVEAYASVGYRRMECTARDYLARILLMRGDVDGALVEAERSASLTADEAAHMAALSTLAFCRLAAGRVDDAMKAAFEAQARVRRAGGADADEIRTRHVWAIALRAAGKEGDALEVATRACTRVLEAAERIDDVRVRRHFLWAVPEHVGLLRMAGREDEARAMTG